MTPDAGPPARPRPSGIPLGRVLGVPVYLRWSWLLLAAVVVVLYAGVLDTMLPQLTLAGRYAFAVGFVLCLLLSVLLHEVGHAVVARHYGIRVRTIMLEVLGGYTEMDSDSPHPRADLAVSAVGPIVSAVLGAVTLVGYLSLPRGTVISQLLFQLAWANLVVAVFNARPGLPLDGGRAVRAVVWGLTGNRHTATTVAGWLGRGLAAALAVTAIALLVGPNISIATPLLLMLLASTIWQGATIAIIQGRVLARLPRVNLRQLARPVLTVPTGMPLAEVIRRVAESGLVAPGVAVVDSSGRAVALVHEESAAAVPPERRPWIPIDSVARTLEPGRTLSAEMSGEDVINAVRARPAPEYLVVSGPEVIGVLRLADLDRVLRT
jgi:Zn-dependent protease